MIKLNKNHELYQQDLDNIIAVDGIDSIFGKSVLVTGATGMLGLVLIDALMKCNNIYDGKINLYVTGRSESRARLRLGEYFDNPFFHFFSQDVREPLPKDLQVDYIIPFASNTHPLAYSKYPVETIEINVEGARHALNKACQCNSVLLYPSSVEIYGNGNDAFDENFTGHLNLASARSCYPESKRVAEALCLSYIEEYHIKCKIVRLSRIFGPSMLDSDTKASSQFIKKSLAGENIILKSKGDQLYSYTYVADAVKAILFVMIHGNSGEAYNVASDKCNVALAFFAKMCANLSGLDIEYDIPSTEEAKGYSIATKAILSTGKLKTLGWSSEYEFSNALARTLKILKYERDII